MRRVSIDVTSLCDLNHGIVNWHTVCSCLGLCCGSFCRRKLRIFDEDNAEIGKARKLKYCAAETVSHYMNARLIMLTYCLIIF